MFSRVANFIHSIYPGRDSIPLHEPRFFGKEKEYLEAAIDSTYVSYVGAFVGRLEEMICKITGASFAVAVVNGTAALHVALRLAGVQAGDEVVTQPLTFIAPANAISYCGARPIFLDVDRQTLGLSPEALEAFLKEHAQMKNRVCYHKATGRRIAACVPIHTFGHPCRIDRIRDLCESYHLAVVEDAAESLGSTYKDRHTGTFGLFGIYSFNGNKTVTGGGGGALVTHNEELANRAKHITTTAKVPHPYEYVHDAIGYNYRLPNLNAALACAQLEQLDLFIENKRELAGTYRDFFASLNIPFLQEPSHARSNYWLNAVILPDRQTRDDFLRVTHSSGILTRPVWQLLNRLEMYKDCQTDGLENARWFEDRVVNIPSSVRI